MLGLQLQFPFLLRIFKRMLGDMAMFRRTKNLMPSRADAQPLEKSIKCGTCSKAIARFISLCATGHGLTGFSSFNFRPWSTRGQIDVAVIFEVVIWCHQ